MMRIWGMMNTILMKNKQLGWLVCIYNKKVVTGDDLLSLYINRWCVAHSLARVCFEGGFV